MPPEEPEPRVCGGLAGLPCDAGEFCECAGGNECFFECSDAATITRFADILSAAHISSPVRATRGDDILAACGQLKSASERRKKAAPEAATSSTRSSVGELNNKAASSSCTTSCVMRVSMASGHSALTRIGRPARSRS